MIGTKLACRDRKDTSRKGKSCFIKSVMHGECNGCSLQMDEVLASVAEKIKNFAVIYVVDITEVPEFNTMYELYDPSTVMFFFRNKHIMIDLGTGNNNKINWALKDKQEFIDIVETVYRGARKGRGLVIAPKDYSTKYRY
ncbi:thioredoxin-like protein YLS8 isoform X2 [Gossypium raimondii]|uniref:thioredoxin-like protein YLS8 isoform X2 n=1 Tax=Gossypium raimondii TaxID=29730 RepID=UPI00227BE309|nr:thioredoxin-like protein YLS8 isoform X2 [Gossypium raimondii]